MDQSPIDKPEPTSATLPLLANFCQISYVREMGTMNISLPDSMKGFVDEQVAERGYGTSSEYIRDLIRRDQDNLRLRRLLLEGAESPIAGAADQAYFESLRKRVGVGSNKRTSR